LDQKKSTRILTVTSGKGGVGKTNISTNLALALAQEGSRTCLFDADLGLANIDIVLGLNPEFTLEDVILGQKELNDIIIKGFHGIDIIPGSSGVEKLVSLEKEQIRNMAASLGTLSHYDFLIFDTSAGISVPVIAFCMTAGEVLLVITPEPTSMTDAYALLKVLVMNGFNGVVKLVVNQCKTVNQAKKIYQIFNKTIQTYLNIGASLTGVLLSDPIIVEAVKQQEPFLYLYPDSNATKCIQYLAKAILGNESKVIRVQDMVPFWGKCFHIMKQPLIMKESLKTSHKIDHHRNHSGEDIDQVNLMEMVDLMNKLVSGVVTVSDELRQIKEYLGNGHIRTAIAQPSSMEVLRYSEDSNRYFLDYEAYLKNADVNRG
jgi:flagellar biosynthesis protein FlhG